MDPILYWNEVALEANKISHTEGGKKHPGVNGPTLSSRALSMVHLAMYDACKGAKVGAVITDLYNQDAGLPTGPVSQDAAIAAAAHAMLSRLYPNMKQLFNDKHCEGVLNSANHDAGHQYGILISNALWAKRKDDAKDSDDGYAVSHEQGKHRPDPNNPADNNAPFYRLLFS